MKIFARVLAMGAWLVPLCAAAQQDTLGRLFYTPAERAEMEARRFGQPAPQEAAARAIASVLRVDGIALRPQGRTTVWINGTPYLERDLPHGLRVRRDSRGRVLGVEMPLKDGEVERAAIGETLTQTLSSAALAASAPAARAEAIKPGVAK